MTRDRDTQGVSEVALQVHIVDAANDHGRYPQALGLAKGLGSDEPSAHDNRAGARLIDHLGYEHGVRGVHEHADGPVHLAPHAGVAGTTPFPMSRRFAGARRFPSGIEYHDDDPIPFSLVDEDPLSARVECGSSSTSCPRATRSRSTSPSS